MHSSSDPVEEWMVAQFCKNALCCPFLKPPEACRWIEPSEKSFRVPV